MIVPTFRLGERGRPEGQERGRVEPPLVPHGQIIQAAMLMCNRTALVH
jgi:hypothetical protein